MQTQQISLPSPPVTFYRKMFKAVASGVFDPPWIPIPLRHGVQRGFVGIQTGTIDRDPRPDAY